MAEAGSAAPSVAHPHPDEGHHHPHPHHRSCLSVAARVALRSFLVVLGVRAALSAVSIVARRRALRALIGADDLRMCAFAALFSGGVKAVNCFLVRVCELPPRRASLVSGAGAGLSIALLPPRERRTVVLYALVRAAEFAGRTALLTGRVPAPLARFQHWDVLIMCLSAMQILFSYVACPHTLDGSYLHFLRQHGAKDPRALKAIEQWFRRQPWNAADVAAVCQHAAIAVPQYEHFSPCMFTHPGTGCAAHFVRYLPPVFQRSLRLYLPVHLLYVAYLLYARRAHLNPRSVQQLGWLFVNNLLRSCLFLSFYCATAWLMLCTTVSGLRMRSIPVGRLTQFFPGLALLFEFSSRRLELALYCAPRAIESAWNELKWHGYARPVPHADVALFAAAAAAVVYCHHHRRDALRGSVKTALTWLWHE